VRIAVAMIGVLAISTSLLAGESFPISISTPASIALPAENGRPAFTVRIEYDLRGECGLTNECLVISLTPKARGALKPLQTRLKSSYGFFRLYLADLTGDGLEELVTITGVGGGTCAREEFMTVQQWNGGDLRQLLRTMVSRCYGPSARWWYEPDLERSPDSDTVQLVLSLEHDPLTSDPLEIPELIPSARRVVFAYDRSTGTLRPAQ
jgi:hypothetical protein